MFLTKIGDALKKGEADIAKVLATVVKDAPVAEQAAEAFVAVFAPSEAKLLQTLFSGANALTTELSTVLTDVENAQAAGGTNVTVDSTLFADVKALVGGVEAALKALGVK